mmetsp:Transcript_19534/g.45511  ORF Transcript_19534/g.45511 Transcript_19534/m.45511 type:complete len:114 (+) Transcript_19534:1358-1699(+)
MIPKVRQQGGASRLLNTDDDEPRCVLRDHDGRPVVSIGTVRAGVRGRVVVVVVVVVTTKGQNRGEQRASLCTAPYFSCNHSLIFTQREQRQQLPLLFLFLMRFQLRFETIVLL